MINDLKKIIECSCSKEEKIKKVEEIILQAEDAIDIINGKLKYCQACKDYYNSKSFFIKIEKKDERICVYEDPINSGGNEYVDGYAIYTYEVCPKNHKTYLHKETHRR